MPNEKEYFGKYCKQGKDIEALYDKVEKNRTYEAGQRHNLSGSLNLRMLGIESDKLNTKVFYFTAMVLIGVLGFLFSDIAGVEGELRGYQTETRNTLSEIQVAIAKMQVSIDNLIRE